MNDPDIIFYIGYLLAAFGAGWALGFKFLMIRKMFDQF